MAIDYLGMLGQGANAWYGEKKFDQARDDITGGYETARDSVEEYQTPYSDFGLESMQASRDQGEFSFSNEDFYKDPSYQFRMDESMDQIQRSQAAKKMLASTGTLSSMQSRAGDLASQEYQAAFDRAKSTYDTNTQKNQFGLQLGADAAMNIGDNLADIGIGEGMSLAQLNGMQAQRMSEIISSTLAAAGQASDPNTVSGMLNKAISSGVGTVGDWLKGKASEYGLSMLGGGATAAGTTAAVNAAGGGFAAGGWQTGAAGLDAALGGTSVTGGGWGAGSAAAGGEAAAGAGLSGSGATAVAGSFGAWAGSVVPALGIMFALKTGVEMLRGDSKWTKVMDGMPKDGDPLKYIAGLSEDKLPKQGTGKIGETALNPRQSRGQLYGAILNNMTDEQMEGLRYHNNIGTIVGDLLAFANSGVGSGGKDSLGGDPTAVLEKLFPEIAGNITLQNRKETDKEENAYWDNAMQGDMGGSMQALEDMQRANTEKSYSQWGATSAKNGVGFIEGVSVQQYINQKLRYWSGQKTAGEIATEFSYTEPERRSGMFSKLASGA